MPRLVRIALTLFISATILVLLVQQRAMRLQEDLAAVTGHDAEQLAQSEERMIAVGIILAGLLALGGFVLIILAFARGRRKLPDHEG